jgi:hypothetical protein
MDQLVCLAGYIELRLRSDASGARTLTLGVGFMTDIRQKSIELSLKRGVR